MEVKIVNFSQNERFLSHYLRAYLDNIE